MKFTIFMKNVPEVEKRYRPWVGHDMGDGVTLCKLERLPIEVRTEYGWKPDTAIMLRCKASVINYIRHRNAFSKSALHMPGWTNKVR